VYLQLIKDRLSSFLNNFKNEMIKEERNEKNTDFIKDGNNEFSLYFLK